MGSLSNKTIVVTRPEGQSSQFSMALQELGAIVLDMPALAIVPPTSWQALDQALDHLADYRWLILTSVNGVDYFFQRLHDRGYATSTLDNLNIAVVGKKTAQRLQTLGLQPDLIPANFIADSLAAELGQREPMAQQRILFPRVEQGGREVLVQELTAEGAIVTEVAAYQSTCPDRMADAVWAALQAGQVDMITFASSKTVHCCWSLLIAQGATAEMLAQIAIASIGPQTSATCRSLFGRVDIEAKEFTLDGLTQAIVAWCDRQAGR